MSNLTTTFADLQVARERLTKGLEWANSSPNLIVNVSLSSAQETRNTPAPKLLEREFQQYLQSHLHTFLADYLASVLDEVKDLELKFRQLSANSSEAFPDLAAKIDAIRQPKS